MNTSDLQFNIIFTPDTVEYLSPFVHTLLKWSDCQYQLVANGCSEHDRQLLQIMCANQERLEYAMVSQDQMLEHGEALNWLVKRNQSEWFCFMDSDILATGDFTEQLKNHLNDLDLLASGHPLWHAPEDISIPKSFRRLHGIHFQTAEGMQLGGTYFTAYRQALLQKVMTETGMDFCMNRWDFIPPEHQQTLREIGMQKMEYDTGLVLTCLLHANGARIQSLEMPEVCHLGGVSAMAGDVPPHFFFGRPDRIATRIFGGKLATPLLRLTDSWYALTKPSPGFTTAETNTLCFKEKRNILSRIRKRNATANYFNALLRRLLQGSELPAVPKLGYKPAEDRIAGAAIQVQAVFDEQGLSGSRIPKRVQQPGTEHDLQS